MADSKEKARQQFSREPKIEVKSSQKVVKTNFA
jgi:hypothetical protein